MKVSRETNDRRFARGIQNPAIIALHCISAFVSSGLPRPHRPPIRHTVPTLICFLLLAWRNQKSNFTSVDIRYEKIYCRTGDDLCYRTAGSTQGASRGLLPFGFANTGPCSGLLRAGVLPRRLLLWPLWLCTLPATLLASSILVPRTLVLQLRKCRLGISNPSRQLCIPTYESAGQASRLSLA
jgi:hypothetical protein